MKNNSEIQLIGPDTCFNVLTRKRVPCQPVVTPVGAAAKFGSPAITCCLNKARCCFDCVSLNQFISCANSLDNGFAPQLITPFAQQPLLSVSDFIFYFNLNCDKYRIIDGLGILDQQSLQLYECYKTFRVTYGTDVTPHSQCFVMESTNPLCPDLGICYYVELKPTGAPDYYFYSVTGAQVCLQPDSVGPTQTDVKQCNTCALQSAPTCQFQTNTLTYNPTPPRGSTQNVTFNLVVPDCCIDNDSVTIFGQPDPNISVIGQPVIVPIAPGVVSITVQVDYPLVTPPGNRFFRIFLKGGCADIDVNLKISVV